MSLRANKRIFVKKYFDFQDDKAKCKLCSHILKSYRTFNLRTHLRKLHNIKDDELQSAPKTSAAAFNSNSPEKKMRKYVTKMEINRNDFFRSYIGLVMEDNIPIDVLDSENFKNIIDPISRGMGERLGKKFYLNSNNCKRVLQLVSDNVRRDIKLDTNHRLLSFKVDNIDEPPANVFVISVQFIKNSETQSHMLGMMKFEDLAANPFQKLFTEMLNILTKFDVSLNQIVSITSGNVTNLIETKNWFDCDAEGQKTEEVYMRNARLLEDASQINLGDIQICRCLAFTAQLCVLDLLKDSEVKNFIFSCRNFVKFLHKSAKNCLEIFELSDLSIPQLDCPNRWGSTYSMIKSLRAAKDILIDRSFEENFELSNSCWDYIEAYYLALEPLHLAIEKFQEQQLHYGNFYAEWLKSKICTQKLLEKTRNVYVKNIAKMIIRSMEDRTKDLLSNEILLACLYLDPRFNHTLTAENKLHASTYLKNLYNRIETTDRFNVQIKIENSIGEPCEEGIEFSQKADEFLNEYLTQNLVANSNVYSKIENLHLPFLRVDSNVLQFWKDKQYSDPELYALSNVCFAVPANQIVEQTVSSLKRGFDETNENNQDILDSIFLIKQNDAYLNQAIEDLPLFEDDS